MMPEVAVDQMKDADFALSAAPLPMDEVRGQARLFADGPLADVLGRLPLPVIVLNASRQIVYANEGFAALRREAHSTGTVGLRIGEALACANAAAGPGGCGTSAFCRYCAAARAVLASLEGIPAMLEGAINRRDQARLSGFDFRVWAWPVTVSGQTFHAAALLDVAHEKRLALLERVFYHDILNFISGMKGLCQIMRENPEEVQAGQIDLLLYGVDRITEIIFSQRDFAEAERGEYAAHPVKMGSLAALSDTVGLMRREPACQGRTLELSPDTADAFLETDRKLLARVLVNILKNALEATPEGGRVEAGCRAGEGAVTFWVNNPGVMPEAVRLQIFKRSFSTKGPGRGLGTYAMKLFAEEYLQGEVAFTSTAAEGTTFFLRLPLATPRAVE